MIIGEKAVGYIGEVHPDVLDRYDKLLAYFIRFRAADRTPEEKDVTEVMDKILKKMEILGVKIRQ